MRELYLIPDGDGTVLLREDGRNAELLRDAATDPAGTVYMGKTDRIMKNLEAAFVDIGTGKDAFLPLKENSETFTGPELKSGMKVPVQIRKEAHGSKGAFLSRDLTVPGTYMILMPMNRHIGISAKIADEGTRNRLKELGLRMTGGKTGLVMRTAAAEAAEAELTAEYDRLTQRWTELEKRISAFSGVGAVDEKETLTAQLIRDYGNGGIDRIVTCGEPAFRTDIPVCYAERDEILRVIRTAGKEALKRTVTLPHGGTLVIDPCEAMTVIDVNTASDSRQGNGFLETDLEACGEIARQIRLRNLSGIIIVDMIDLETDGERERVLEALREETRKDRVKTVVHGMTGLGLVEMTRKRTGLSVYEQREQIKENRPEEDGRPEERDL